MFLTRYLLALMPALFLLTQVVSFNKYLTSMRHTSIHKKLSITSDNEYNHNTEYILNVGKAVDVLIRELPVVFALDNFDFTILSSQITVINGNKRALVLSKEMYVTAIRGIQMASTLSSTYPSIRVRKIEYIEDIKTIQCLVDVAPSSNQLMSTVNNNTAHEHSLWEGMFYFGLDKEGLIETHVFDRKISNLKPEEKINCCQLGKVCNG
jgi:hypothetical protein